MIRDYLRQAATHYPRGDPDGYGSHAYGDGEQIAVRFEEDVRLIANPQGEEVTSEARVFSVAELRPGDRVQYAGRTWHVIASAPQYDLGGRFSHYESRL